VLRGGATRRRAALLLPLRAAATATPTSPRCDDTNAHVPPWRFAFDARAGVSAQSSSFHHNGSSSRSAKIYVML